MKKLKKLTKTDLKKVKGSAACSFWIPVTAPCGAEYYLCADNYQSGDQLFKAIKRFDSAKC
ncbi:MULTISPECIES: hypothetical protein [Elizabethkingia]|uniref:Bacteriocin n=3 Tax=Elizabethkingia TaxID=308865 RepID=A0A7T7V047_9FLAO|nr:MULTISPECIES: hypothetical protein [Elizabethkingia]AQW93084.1 hypothetical protein BBD30_02225 [Elizabethkingia anophelis]AQX02168.1 hypothetical protein BBD32_12160 [Elizabethkingia anophelis]AQX85722.1 hypothetical protein AYC65_12220 [Elizabethkingia bruuniana]KFC35520.1 hypothetical protein FF18_03850 [Elizabethkingia anophelis]KGO09132.1 hypothetical protein KS04_16425 [Elizabethkingia miricola]